MKSKLPVTVRILMLSATLGLTCAPVLADGADVTAYLLLKGRVFTQTNSGTPALRTDAPPFEFSASVLPADGLSVISASLRKPNGATIDLTIREEDGNEFRLAGQYATKAALDAAYPNGAYHFSIVTVHDGTRSITRLVRADDYPPGTPRISNWAALQHAQADFDLSVIWDAWAGGTADDFVRFSLEDAMGNPVIESGEPGDSDALNGTNTSVTISAGRLQPGQSYRGRLLFANATFDPISYPGAVGIAAFYKETGFTLLTPASPPPAGRFQFSSTAFAGVESSGSLNVRIQRDRTEGAASVLLTTLAGTATPGLDFGDRSERIHFADTVGTVDVSLPIADDYLLEGDETILLTLSDPRGGADLGFPTEAVGTIIDDEIQGRGTLQFTATSYTFPERAGFVNLIVTRTGGSAGEVSVVYAAESGTATNGGANPDFGPFRGGLVFSNGVTSLPLRVPIRQDTIDEVNESFTVTLVLTTGGAALGARTAATVTIRDDDTAGILAFSRSLYTVPETDTNLAVVVRRAGGAASAVTVDLVITGGTATEEADYERSGGTSVTLEFGAGVSAVTNFFAIKADRLPEGDETILLELRNPTGGARLARSTTSTIKILDDESVIQFASDSYTFRETAGAAVIFLERSGPVIEAATVTVGTTSNGSTASAFEDYIPTNIVVTFAPGQRRKPVVIRLVNDYLVEAPETVQLVLKDPVAPALLGLRDRATLNITSEDTAGRIGFSVVSTTVRESSPYVPITILRRGGLGSNVTARLQTAAISAVDGFNYVGTNLTLSFAARETRKVVNIPILPNGLDEGPKSFQVTLDNATDPLEIDPLRSSESVFIVDDDQGGVVGFSRAEYIVTENTTNALITITRTRGSASNVVVRFQTADDTATAFDYRAVDTLVSFGAGETSKTVEIEINYVDKEIEPTETVKLTLSDYMGEARPGLSNAVLKILDDESSIAFAAATASGQEGTSVTLTVVRSGALTTAVSVDYVTLPGTASGGIDYTRVNGTLNFAPNQARQTIVVPLSFDPVEDPNETFTVLLHNPQGGVALGSLESVVVTIIDRFDPNAIPLAGSEFLKLTARGVTNSAFRRSFTATTAKELQAAGEGAFRITGNSVNLAAETTETFLVNISEVNGPGIYPVSDASSLYSRAAASGGFVYAASGPGTIIVDRYDGTTMSGRFDLLMSPSDDETALVRVTGSFRVRTGSTAQ